MSVLFPCLFSKFLVNSNIRQRRYTYARIIISNSMDRSKFVYFATASVNLMSMVAGMGYAWPSPFIPKLNGNVDPENNPLKHPTTLLEDSWITSLQSLGAICGPLFTGYISNRLGKKKTLLIFSLPIMACNFILIFANTVIHFYIARFLLGIGTGCVFSLIPIYVAEISEVSDRGTTSLGLPIMMTSVQVFTYVVGPYITIRTLAIISLLPSFLFLILFGVFVPESPYYLVLSNKSDHAELALTKLRRKNDVYKELLEITTTVEETKTEISFRNLIKSKTVRKGLLISLGLLFFQQFSGILAIVSYLQIIFDSTNGFISGDKSVMIIGVIQFATILLVTKLISSVGRKTLLLLSFSGAFLSLISLGFYFFCQEKRYNIDSMSWLPIASVSFYIFCFNLGIGPIPWTVIGEIFPSNVKSYLSSIAALVMLISGFLISLFFPTVSLYLGMAWSLWIFAGFVACAIIFTSVVLPETKDKSFLEIQLILDQ